MLFRSSIFLIIINILIVSINGQKSSSILFPRLANSSLAQKEVSPEFSLVSQENLNFTECTTLNGKSCIFPFIYQNQTFESCITLNDPDEDYWCSTKVDEFSNHIIGGGHWGHCKKNCLTDLPRKNSDQIEDLPEETCTILGDPGICQPASTCPFLVFEDDDSAQEQQQCSEASHVCCKEFLQNDPEIVDKLAASALQNEEFFEKPDDVSLETVEETLTSIRFGNFEAVLAEEDNEDAIFDSTNNNNDNKDEEDLSPTQFHLAFNRPRSEVLFVDQIAGTFLKTTEELKNAPTVGLRSSFGFFDSETSPRINKECPWTPAPSCVAEAQSKFRTIDGSCNNLNETNYGRAATPFQRILDAEYSGSTQIQAPRIAKDGFDLPSARKISTSVAKMDSGGSDLFLDQVQTVLVMQMGQFIDHDITHTPNHGIDCCNKSRNFPGSFDTNKCLPIQIPRDDPFWKGANRCMNLARSLSSPNLKCSLETRQQMNQITHWLDASNIYGSSNFDSRLLRSFTGGRLKDTKPKGPRSSSRPTSKNVLPTCAKESKTNRENIGMCKKCKHCFFAGDVRANEQLNLIVMHTVWMREHNRIAKQLQFHNPTWEDEQLFQEARRIVIAEYQHIIFNEWLPLVIGQELLTSFGLRPLSKGYSNQYLDSFDPRVTNEFATAAFRFGHSLIPTEFNQKIRNSPNQRSSKQIKTTRMKDIFFKPKTFQDNPGIMDDLVRGLATQNGRVNDNRFSEDVINHLFESKSNQGGLDLVALNIQRGRDHGLPGYNAYREECGVGKARDFDDFKDFISANDVENLKKNYQHVDDVDLYVGGFLEKAHRDSILGPTFKCIVADTFARLKIGDRFFYDLGKDKLTKFSPIQLQEIRKTSMARVLCDNTENVVEMQPQAFKTVGSNKFNIITNCNDKKSIPQMNLKVF